MNLNQSAANVSIYHKYLCVLCKTTTDFCKTTYFSQFKFCIFRENNVSATWHFCKFAQLPLRCIGRQNIYQHEKFMTKILMHMNISSSTVLNKCHLNSKLYTVIATEMKKPWISIFGENDFLKFFVTNKSDFVPTKTLHADLQRCPTYWTL